jgi:hypothetical protein
MDNTISCNINNLIFILCCFYISAGCILGGTDIIACFMGQNWTVPVYRGEVQGFTLGCAMEARDESGKTMKKIWKYLRRVLKYFIWFLCLLKKVEQ